MGFKLRLGSCIPSLDGRSVYWSSTISLLISNVKLQERPSIISQSLKSQFFPSGAFTGSVLFQKIGSDSISFRYNTECVTGVTQMKLNHC